MSIGSAYAATIGGYWDKFDAISGYVEQLIKRLNALDDEDADSLIDIGLVDGEIDAVGGREEMLADLEAAKAKIAEVCLVCQRTEAALPD